MADIVGKEPFIDNTVTRLTEPGVTKPQSEYRGPPATAAEPAPSSKPARGFGGLLRRLSGADAAEAAVARREEAAKIRNDSFLSFRRDQNGASVIAEKIWRLPDADIRRLLPELPDKPLPRHGDLRWLEVAKTAIDAIHKHVDHGADARLSPSLGRAARIESVDDLDMINPRKPISEQLAEATNDRATEVRHYLSKGPDIDDARRRQSEVRGRFGPSQEQYERQMAEARLGLVAPADVVEQARRFYREGSPPWNPQRTQAVRMPDDNPRIHPNAREAAIDAEVARGRAVPAAADQIRAEPRSPAQEPARAAAMAAISQGRGV